MWCFSFSLITTKFLFIYIFCLFVLSPLLLPTTLGIGCNLAQTHSTEWNTLKIDTKIVNYNNPSLHILFSICFILTVSPLRSETTDSIIFISHRLRNWEIGTH